MPRKTIDDYHIPVGRAVDELRRSRGVVLTSDKTAYAFLPVESLCEKQFRRLRALKNVRLRVVITAVRAKALGLKAADAVTLDASKFSFGHIKFLADPLQKPTPIKTVFTQAGRMDALALTLSRYASLLPAVLIVEASNIQKLLPWQAVGVSDVAHYMTRPIIDIEETAQAQLPLGVTERARITGFRQRHGTSVHLALVIGAPKTEPLVRVHSSCITGDILGSLRCDCGDQLHLALAAIAHEGAGILLYLHQEGRGIGITNKIRAYALQEQGYDTYEANQMLGFEEDERDFAIAAAILKKMGFKKVRLLTNNPHKMAALKKHGMTITKRQPLIAPSGKHNHAYIKAKAKSGHWF